MHIAIQLLLVLIFTGLGCQVATSLVPPGTPRLLVLVAISGGAAVLIFNRILSSGLLGS